MVAKASQRFLSSIKDYGSDAPGPGAAKMPSRTQARAGIFTFEGLLKAESSTEEFY